MSGLKIDELLVHREWVGRVARTLVLGDAEAEDLEQRAWVRAIEHPPSSPLRSPRGWLRTLLRLASIDEARTRGARRRRERASAIPERVDETPADLVARAETHERLVHSVLALEEPYRTTILLRYFEDLKPGEIARRQGVPVETVRTRVKRALAILRENLDGDSRGDREAWCRALLALSPLPALAAGEAAATTAKALTLGGLLMAKKALAVVAAVLLVAGTGWLAFRSAPEAVPPSPPVDVSGSVAPVNRPLPEPSPAAVTSGSGALVGRLVRGWPLRPVPGTVSVEGSGPARVAAADPGGVFRVEGLARGVLLTATIASPGLVQVRLPGLRIPENGPLDLGDVVLGAGQRLEFLVVDTGARPLAGAEVALHRPSPAWEHTGEYLQPAWTFPPCARAVARGDGHVVFDGLAPSMVVAVATAPGFERRSLDVDAQEGAAGTPVRILLRPACSLAGRVLGPDGEPRPGVMVLGRPASGLRRLAADFGFASSVADGEGRYRLEGLSPGQVDLQVRLPSGLLRTAGRAELPGEAERDIRLPAGATLRGSVLDAATAAPVADASVRITVRGRGGYALASLDTRSGPEGTFAAGDLPAGETALVEVRREGYLPWPGADSITQNAEAVMTIAGEVGTKEVRLERGAVITGHVLSGDGNPVGGAQVAFLDTVFRLPPGTRTEADGAFRIGPVRAGRGLLRASAEGWIAQGFPAPSDIRTVLQAGDLPAAWAVEVPLGGEVVKDLVLSPSPVGAVEGTVVESDGTPARGFSVRVDRAWSHVTFTDAQGAFRLSSVPPGDGMVATASSPGRAPGSSAPFRVEEGGTVRGVGITVPSGAAFAGTVRREDGGDPQGALLWCVTGTYAEPPAPWYLPMKGTPHPVGPGGAFRIEGVPPGTYTLFAVAGGSAMGSSPEMEATPGGTTEGIEILLPRGRTLSGRVEDGAGAPVKGAAVEVLRSRPGRNASISPDRTLIARATTGRGGTFEVGGLAAGEYEVTAASPGRVSALATAAAGTGDLVLVLGESFPVSGTVVDEATGSPVPGVGITLRAVSPRPGMDDPPLVVSGRDGGFTVEGLAPGSHRVVVEPGATGYGVPAPRFLEAGAREVRIALPAGLVIEGHAVDEEGRALGGGIPLMLVPQPRANPADFFRNRHLQTGPDGGFRAGGLPPGRYDLHHSSETPFLPAEMRGIQAGTTGLVFRLIRGVPVAGRVTEEDGATPIAVASVSAAGTSTRVRSDGTFTTSALRPGVPLALTASAPGHEPTTLPGVLAGAKDIVLRLARSPGNAISGQVLDEDGNPAPAGIPLTAFAIAYLEEMEKAYAEDRPAVRPEGPALTAWTHTAADGTFRFEGLADRRYGIWATDAFSWKVADAVDAAAGDSGVVVPWARTFEFAGRVVDGAGRPCAGRTLWLEWTKTPIRARSQAQRTLATADFDGRFVFRGINRGTVVLRAESPSGEVPCGTYEVPCGVVEVRVPGD